MVAFTRNAPCGHPDQLKHNSYLPGAATEVESVPFTLELGAKDQRND